MGDISVDGEPIELEELPDTINVNNQGVINQSVISKPFELNDNSTFNYGVEYGVATPKKAIGYLTSGQRVNFKVELIDAESNEVIGVFDEVTYDENNLDDYDNLYYQVNSGGIGTRIVKLRLQITENIGAEYTISDKLSESTMFNKEGHKEVNYKGNLAVTDYSLSQNYPNPFNPSTVIKYELPKANHVTLKVYDILGKEVAALVDREQEQGRYEVSFDGSKLSSGVYICRITAGEFVKSIKMNLIK